MPVDFPVGLETFADVNAFYAADERRRFSGEADFGIFWWDGVQGHSDTWRVSVVALTGEMYACRSETYRRGSRPGDVVLLGKLADSDPEYVIADRVLTGWNLECGKTDSLGWVIDRVQVALDFDERRPPITFLLRHKLLGGHVHVDVFSGRTPGSRGRAGELIFREEEWPHFRDALVESLGDRLELVDRVADAAESG